MALRGSRAKEVKRKKLADHPLHGVLSGLPQRSVERAIYGLLDRGVLERRGRKYPTVWVAGKRVRPKTTQRRKPDKTGLRATLKAYRRAQARRRRVKPYQVYTDAVIDAVIAAKPQTMAALAALPGMGPARLAKYGEAILEAVAAHRGEGAS